MRRLVLMLILLSGAVIADRAGLVVQFDSSTVIKKCVEFQTGASAFDVLNNSGLQVVTRDYGPGLGVAICGIKGIGCSADNCFCQSDYWSFSYLVGGKWAYSDVGISSYTVNNGDVLGFRWGAYGDQLELYSLEEICPSAITQGGVAKPIMRFDISMSGNCTNKSFVINVKENVDKAVVWEPTAFFPSGSSGYADVENGAGIKVLLHEVYSGRDAGFENVAFLFTDKEGNASFIPMKPGVYRLEFEKYGFLREYREVDIDDCVNETVVLTNRSVEEPAGEKVEPNITRVDIIAPQSAVVNSTVTVELMSDEGKPIAYGSIVVDFSGGRKELVTNESGEAAFTAPEEGVYSYSSPGNILYSYRVTNVVEPTKVEFKGHAGTQVVEIDEVAPSAAMATAGASPEIVGAGVVLVLVLLYFIQGVM